MSGNDQEEPYELYDQYHGCHYVQEEETLVLAERLGSGSFKMVLLDGDSAAAVGKGKFRLIYQHRDMDGYIELPAVISEEDISTDLAKSVLRMEDRVGALGVYTPDKADAKKIMSSANRPPVETQALDSVLTVLLDFYANAHATGYGNMCFFGPVLSKKDVVERYQRTSDDAMGFHASSIDRFQLAEDLGGMDMRYFLVRPYAMDSLKKGEYHVVIDTTAVSKRDREDAYISDDPITFEQAATILKDTKRHGQVSVFTVDREDALNVMKASMDSKEPYETKDSKGLFDFPGRCFLRSKNGKREPKVIYLS